MTYKGLRRALDERLAVSKYDAAKALGWGRRTTDAAIKAGLMPAITGPGKVTVPCWWLREQLRLSGTEKTAA
jgi:hypothetical protein